VKVPGNESSWEREFQGTKVPVTTGSSHVGLKKINSHSGSGFGM